MDLHSVISHPNLLISGAQLVTVELSTSEVKHFKSDIRVRQGTIVEVADSLPATIDEKILHLEHQLITPGLIESHSHLMPPVDRSVEFALRPVKSYQEIAAQGGGILSSISAMRAAKEEEVLQANIPIIQAYFKQGVTTLELKSGYGQSLECELMQLRVIHRLQQRFPEMTIIPTFLGLHAVPPEFKDNTNTYIQHVCEIILPAVVEQGIAQYADAFCEEGYFSANQIRPYLTLSKKAGLGIRLHADEFLDSQGAALAAEFEAACADHLMAVSEQGLSAMRDAGVIATVLPGTSLFIGKPFAKMRQMIDQGITVAIGTDNNPGSSRHTSLPLMWQLAMVHGKLSLEEGFAGVTRNAALSLEQPKKGIIEPGADADLVIWNMDHLAQIPYMGAESQNRITGMICKGRYYDPLAMMRVGSSPFPLFHHNTSPSSAARVDDAKSSIQEPFLSLFNEVMINEQGLIAQYPVKPPGLDQQLPHAPQRQHQLTVDEQTLAVSNALKYLQPHLHEIAAPRFKQELDTYGHIYAYDFLPTVRLKAIPFHYIPAKTTDARAMIHMILNNLDPDVAQFPQELITYGGNGAVFSNWMQFHIVIHRLLNMEPNQTLSMVSGHPQGLLPKRDPNTASAIITNGAMIPNYSTIHHYDRLYALGVSLYGQMTAGSWMYIGPQGIVHGTHEVLKLAASRHNPEHPTVKGKIFVTSGLGGMSGAQPKAATIAGGICLVAEVDKMALQKRHQQGWLDEIYEASHGLLALVESAKAAQEKGESISLGFLGNVVTLLESLADSSLKVDLISDQTSLHNPYGGGYFPVTIEFEQAKKMMVSDPEGFRAEVQASLRLHVAAINRLTDRGAFFWDYGNAFLKEAALAQAPLKSEYRSYVEDMMGPELFDNGFGPYRWVCLSGDPKDLEVTDQIAERVIEAQLITGADRIKEQLNSNLNWIKRAAENQLTVGSQARILYSNLDGRIALAQQMNAAVANGELLAPIVIGRDHHDVSGTDSPFRETANIKDGSNITADMAMQNVILNAMLGATWVSMHNGGGVGWGEVINCGNGLVLDGSKSAEARARAMLFWDVAGGVVRRARAGNRNAILTVHEISQNNPDFKPFIPGIHEGLTQ